MFASQTLSVRSLACLLALTGLAGCADDGNPLEDGLPVDRPPAGEALVVDISEDMTRFTFQNEPVFEDDGFPRAGNPFVTQGYIYPEGFLADHAGTLADGSPSDPDEVIGEWTCRGHFVGNGARTTTGPWVVTSQHFDLYDQAGFDPAKAAKGRDQLVTQGFEIADVGEPVDRPVTGGLGAYRSAEGASEQTMLGFSEGGGVLLRVVFDLDD